MVTGASAPPAARRRGGVRDAAARADISLISGFDSIRDASTLSGRTSDVRRHLARRGLGAAAVYEHGAFHVSPFADQVVRELGSWVDVWSCNEDELQEQLHHVVDLLSPPEVLRPVREAHSAGGAKRLVVHTRFWALAIGGEAVTGGR